MTEQPAAAAPPQPDLECRQFAELITDYLDGALPEAACERLHSHVAGCEPCRRKSLFTVDPEFSVTAESDQPAPRVLLVAEPLTHPGQGETDSDDAIGRIVAEEAAARGLEPSEEPIPLSQEAFEDIRRIEAHRGSTPSARLEAIQHVFIRRRRRAARARRPAVRPCMTVRRCRRARSSCVRSSSGGETGDAGGDAGGDSAPVDIPAAAAS